MATERINIIVKEHGTRIVQRRLGAIGATASKSALGVNMLRTALVGIGGALVLINTVRTLASFGQAMSTVLAVSEATEAQFKSLTATAKELGATTRFTATQAAEGLVELARAGFEVDEQLISVGQTLRLAQAGALDLKRAAEITSGTIRGFRLEADQAGRVTDVLAFAANDAATDVNQLGEAIKFVAPAAAGMNVELEETVAALQSLADAMLKGTLGGTGLRRVLTELEAPSTKTRRIMRDLGVEAKEFRVTSVGLTRALEVLRDAGVDTGLAFTIFGRRGGGAFEVLSKSIPKIKAATEALRGAEGTTKRIADIMDDNLNGALLRVKSAWEAVQLSFGAAGATDALIALLDRLAEALRFLADNIEIVNAAIITLATLAIPKLVTALVLLTPALSLIAAGAAIGGLVAFRHEINLSKDSIATLGDFAAATWERIKQGAQIMFDLFASAFPDLSNTLSDFFSGFDTSLKGFITGTAQVLDEFVGLWAGVGFVIQAIWRNLGPALKDITISLLNGIIGVFEAGLKKILKAIDNVFSKIPGVDQVFGDVTELELIPRLENTAKNALIGMDEAIAQGFAQGRSTSIFEDSVNELFDRADEIANERLEKLGLDLIKDASAEALPGTDFKGAGTGGGALPSPGQSLAFVVTLENIDREIELLRMSNSERTIANQLKKIENSLAEKNIDLSEQQKETIRVELRHLQLVQQTSAAVDEVVGVTIDLSAAQEELNNQVRAGTITLQQAGEAYRLLEDQALATSKTMEAGFRRGLNSVRRDAEDLGTAVEETVVNAFGSAEDALVSFATTGKFAFKDMVDSILGDLTRLIAKMIIVAALKAAIGGGGSIGEVGTGATTPGITEGPDLGAGKAGGGDVFPGTLYPVGEKGIELFEPSVPGRIVPNDKVSDKVGRPGDGDSGERTPVNVFLVASREEALAAMRSTEGERIIVETNGKVTREASV